MPVCAERNNPSVEVVADHRCHLGEGPLWHEDESTLYWVDILSPRLFRYEPTIGRSAEFPQERVVGGFTVQADGALLLFRDRGNVVTWRGGRTIETIISSIPAEDGQRFNDVIADPEGRVFAGTLTLSADWDDVAQRTGRLYRIDPDGSYHMLFDGIGISNGMGFSPDLARLYFIDTFDCTLWTFDYERATGEIRNRRLLVQFDPGQGRPDGMTVDAGGDLWIAMVLTGHLLRCRPDGSVRQRIDLPTAFVTSLTFGGDDHTRLFVTTGMANDRAKHGPLAGATFALRTEVRGRAEFRSNVRATAMRTSQEDAR